MIVAKFKNLEQKKTLKAMQMLTADPTLMKIVI